MSAKSGKTGRAEERVRTLEDGASNALPKDVASATRREKAKNTGCHHCRTLSEYRPESECMTNVRLFRAMAIAVESLVMYYRKNFQRSSALGAWKNL